MAEMKLIAVGNSVGVILPRELLVKLGLQKGDSLFASDIPDGVQLSVRNSDLEHQLEVARGLMKKWRNVLHELAK